MRPLELAGNFCAAIISVHALIFLCMENIFFVLSMQEKGGKQTFANSGTRIFPPFEGVRFYEELEIGTAEGLL